MENINSPFSVIQNNQHLNRNGSGLGLYITKEILSLCGSELKYNSKKGVGSQFWFEIDDSNSIIDPTMILNDNFGLNTNVPAIKFWFSKRFGMTTVYGRYDFSEEEKEFIKKLAGKSLSIDHY